MKEDEGEGSYFLQVKRKILPDKVLFEWRPDGKDRRGSGAAISGRGNSTHNSEV